MKHDVVNWPETFKQGSNRTACDTLRRAEGDRYDLATALRIVRRMETSTARGAVFEEIKNKNPIYRLVDTLYSMAGARLVQPLLTYRPGAVMCQPGKMRVQHHAARAHGLCRHYRRTPTSTRSSAR